MESTSYSGQILMEFQFYRQIFKNNQIPNLMKILLVGAELFYAAEGRTEKHRDRHGEDKSRFSQFCEQAQKIEHPVFGRYSNPLSPEYKCETPTLHRLARSNVK